MGRTVKTLEDVTIRFAGDSGDGMQLTGTQFTNTAAALGNDLSTLPDYPAEIRAPAGTTYGVSGFQIHFGSTDILTPGDTCDVLVAMNPAALITNVKMLRENGTVIVNEDAFNEKNFKLAGITSNPLEDGSLGHFQVYKVPISKMTSNALADMNLSTKFIDKTKNFFALGLMYWMYNRPLDQSIRYIQEKFKKDPQVIEANTRVLHAGYNYGDTVEIFTTRYEVKPAKLAPGKYRNIMGNVATALGLVAAAKKAGLELFLGSYPITPASDILHELSTMKNFGVKTFQAEDEIAAICSAIGASYAGALGATTTSGPGMALKTEAIGLAIMLELPLVIVNVQRGGPSTGLPTKTEQADLLQAVVGRNGEAPLCVIAASTPADCFSTVYEAARLSVKFMTPVICLTDGYVANGAEPWLIPNVNDLPDIPVTFAKDKETFQPYARDEKTLSRPWAIPGTPGLEHRIGGLEKEHITGNINYDPDNHDFMIKLRGEKIERIADDIPLQTVEGDNEGDLLVLGWGSTYGSIKSAVTEVREAGYSVSHAHLRYINPFPKNLGEILYKFKNVLIPEINNGQLIKLIRSKYLIPAVGFNMVRGLPLRSEEIEQKIYDILGVQNG
ncbi:MAG: 2-oxoacid:acceptor oxidoreductase subunit alpha [Bacteroidetes bacterium]|nr:2-oxoacid:acceptor oxidoreductase subunit alpha [Bacteroidota bacterium]MCW5897497.1 2-oxoacid:acceptor oxidoreductase subunit alpha [Bacteroidota bacterium]